MPQIEIDFSVLESRLQNDPVLASLEQEKIKWRQGQEENKTKYTGRIAAHRGLVKEMKQEKAKLQKEIKRLEREIEWFKGHCRYRSVGLRRIESRIKLRTRHLKFQEVK